ncbi:MAG: hypothetical protein ACFFCS_09615 [Candidatus Hodarchaeota archaeon]
MPIFAKELQENTGKWVNGVLHFDAHKIFPFVDCSKADIKGPKYANGIINTSIDPTSFLDDPSISRFNCMNFTLFFLE